MRCLALLAAFILMNPGVTVAQQYACGESCHVSPPKPKRAAAKPRDQVALQRAGRTSKGDPNIDRAGYEEPIAIERARRLSTPSGEIQHRIERASNSARQPDSLHRDRAVAVADRETQNGRVEAIPASTPNPSADVRSVDQVGYISSESFRLSTRAGRSEAKGRGTIASRTVGRSTQIQQRGEYRGDYESEERSADQRNRRGKFLGQDHVGNRTPKRENDRDGLLSQSRSQRNDVRQKPVDSDRDDGVVRAVDDKSTDTDVNYREEIRQRLLARRDQTRKNSGNRPEEEDSMTGIQDPAHRYQRREWDRVPTVDSIANMFGGNRQGSDRVARPRDRRQMSPEEIAAYVRNRRRQQRMRWPWSR